MDPDNYMPDNRQPSELENLEESNEVETDFEDTVLNSLRLINKNFLQRQVTEELESENILEQNREVDEKIANIISQIEASNKETELIERQLYDNNEMQEQLAASYNKSEEIINILTEELENFKKEFSDFSVNTTNLQEKLDSLKSLQNTKTENEKIYAVKMEENTNLENVIESLCSDALIKENEELKIIVNDKQEKLKNIRLNQKLLQEFNEEKMTLIEAISEKAKAIELIKMERDLKWKEMEQIKIEIMEKMNDSEKRLNEAFNSKSLFSTKYNELMRNYQQTNILIETVKYSISECEKKKEMLEEKVETKRITIDKNNEPIKVELHSKRQYLLQLEIDVETAAAELDNHQKIIDEKQKKLNLLEKEHENSLNKIKNSILKLSNMEHENLQQQTKTATLQAVLTAAKNEFDELQRKNQEANEKYIRSKKILSDKQQEIDEEKTKLKNKFNEEINKLIKQEKYENENIDLMKDRLHIITNENHQFNEIITENKNDLKLLEMKLENRERTLKTTKDSLQHKEKILQSVEKELQQEENSITPKNLSAEQSRISVVAETSMKENTINAGNRSQRIQFENEEELATIPDLIHTANRPNLSLPNMHTGRKSPGILKTPNAPKSPQTPPKKVKFQNVSTTSTSSSSPSSNNENVPLNVNSKFDELLRQRKAKMQSLHIQ